MNFPVSLAPNSSNMNPHPKKIQPSAERQGGELVNTPGQHIGIGTLHQVLGLKTVGSVGDLAGEEFQWSLNEAVGKFHMIKPT